MLTASTPPILYPPFNVVTNKNLLQIYKNKKGFEKIKKYNKNNLNNIITRKFTSYSITSSKTSLELLGQLCSACYELMEETSR